MYYIINNGNERKCGFKTIQNIYDKNNWIKHKEKKERYSPITATNSMLYSKSRQLFVYAFN